MARLSENKYPAMLKTDLCDPVVFVVDMIKGFVNVGPLHDEAISKIEANIEKCLKDLDCNNYFVCDCHPPHTREFNAYPEHCTIGSVESEIVDSLHPYVKRVIHKNSTNTFVAPEFEAFLKDDLKYYKDIVITGCCTDLCIMHFVLSLNTWFNEHNMQEYRIIVPVDCVETYDIDGVHAAEFYNSVALNMMASNGVCVVSKIEG